MERMTFFMPLLSCKTAKNGQIMVNNDKFWFLDEREKHMEKRTSINLPTMKCQNLILCQNQILLMVIKLRKQHLALSNSLRGSKSTVKNFGLMELFPSFYERF